MAQAVRDSIKPHILHEKQEEGSMLCAQHCLNNVLQGHYFDAAQLGDTAKQLDEAEREQLELSDAQWDQREVQNRNADETGRFLRPLEMIEYIMTDVVVGPPFQDSSRWASWRPHFRCGDSAYLAGRHRICGNFIVGQRTSWHSSSI